MERTSRYRHGGHGFIAQEVEEVLSEAVLTQDNEEQTKGLKYNTLVPVLTKAIQELEAQNEALRARISSKPCRSY